MTLFLFKIPTMFCKCVILPLNMHENQLMKYMGGVNALLKSDVTRRDHVSVVMDAGSRIVNFIVNFIRDGSLRITLKYTTL